MHRGPRGLWGPKLFASYSIRTTAKAMLKILSNADNWIRGLTGNCSSAVQNKLNKPNYQCAAAWGLWYWKKERQFEHNHCYVSQVCQQQSSWQVSLVQRMRADFVQKIIDSCSLCSDSWPQIWFTILTDETDLDNYQVFSPSYIHDTLINLLLSIFQSKVHQT